MLKPNLALLASTLLLASTAAGAENWTAVGAGNGHGETISVAIDPGRSYIFECAPDSVLITYTGVTELLDIRGGGKKVGDAPGSVMPEGAALMALFTGKGEPQFLPAEAKPNPKNGWDLTLRMNKSDKALRALEKAEMLSLFTTGYTAALTIDVSTRSQLGSFLARCRG